MRIMITGASGFIGRALCPVLAARGHEVAALERGATGDLTAFADWSRVLTGADAVVHLAAIAHRRGVDDERLREVNVDVPVALGRAAAAAGVRLLFMSSVKVHGEETQAAAFHETSAFTPADAYGRAKADAELALQSIDGLKLTVIRPPLVYGPGVKANFLNLMSAVARGWPLPFARIANRRSLVYSGNLADAVARCLEAPQAVGKTYLVSDGSVLSTPALCRALGVALGVPARLFSFPVAWIELVAPLRKLTRSLEVDDGAIRRDLGWAPPQSMKQGLRLTAAWFRGQGS
jgi:nucleoside-diphosphate-sugar epimerase